MAREMKDSGIEWIGEIPREWGISKVKYFYDCYDGKRVPVDSAERTPGPYPYWGAGNITDYVNDYLFDEEIILLGEDGAPFFDHTRPVAFLINEKIWVNNHIHVLKPKESVISRFFVYWLNNVDYKSYINGSILNKLTQSNMNSIAFVIPSLAEQQSIADFLDAQCAHTVLASWNDFLIDGINPTDDMIINDIVTNWTVNKANTSVETWREIIRQLKEKQMIPKGYGKHTLKKEQNDYAH